MGRGGGGGSAGGTSGGSGNRSSAGRGSGGRMHSASRSSSSADINTASSRQASAPPRSVNTPPRQGYSQGPVIPPRQVYSQPRQTYNAPRQAYNPPRQTYNQPRQTYNQPRQPIYNSPVGGNVPPRNGAANGGAPMGGGGMGCGTGCSLAVIAVIVLFVVGFIGLSMMGTSDSYYQSSDTSVRTAASASSGSITPSSKKRDKLDARYSTQTAYYVDELGWITEPDYLNSSMKEFYDTTGVWPLLYITDTVNGTMTPTERDMSIYATQLYSQFCPDEGHMLLLFHCLDESEDYSMWYTTGSKAEEVMDDEACDILMDYIDSYFYTDKTESQMFGDAYTAAAKRIMTRTISPTIYVVIFAGIIGILIVLFMWWRKRKEQKAIEYQRTQELLNTELHTFDEQEAQNSNDELEAKYADAQNLGDQTLEDLEKKYSDS